MKPISEVGKKLVSSTFEKQKLLIYLGTQLKRIENGEVELYFPKSEISLQHHGFVHGGIISTIADTAAGLAGFSVLNDINHSCITVEMKINFMRPADTDLICIGKLLRENKSLMVTTAEVFTTEKKMCAFMLQTIKRITPEIFIFEK